MVKGEGKHWSITIVNVRITTAIISNITHTQPQADNQWLLKYAPRGEMDYKKFDNTIQSMVLHFSWL